jgi:hypothetical protein
MDYFNILEYPRTKAKTLKAFEKGEKWSFKNK